MALCSGQLSKVWKPPNFGYMSIVSILFFVLTGSIGTISSFFFVRVIYGSIKVD